MFEEPNAVQIRVELADIQPAVWRRLVLPTNWNLRQLHLSIQAAFNWWNNHLHEFRIGGLRYGDVDSLEETGSRVFDEREIRLCDFERTSTSFLYVYDFGDEWRHVVEIEKYLAFDAELKRASCIAGARARPPEDVGGPPGYQDFLAVMADPNDPEHADMKRWCGGHLIPSGSIWLWWTRTSTMLFGPIPAAGCTNPGRPALGPRADRPPARIT